MKWSENSCEMRLKGPVYLDFFRQTRYLLSQVNMRLKFIRAKSDFSLISFSGANFKVNITSAVLYVRKVLMNPKVIHKLLTMAQHELFWHLETTHPSLIKLF